MNSLKREILQFCILAVISLSLSIDTRAQMVYDELPHYGKSQQSEMHFILDTIAPIIQKMNCRTEDSLFLSTFTAMLTIDQNGKIDAVSFPNLNIDSSCEKELAKGFMKMDGWISGRRNGKRIKSQYPYHISCLLWEEH